MLREISQIEKRQVKHNFSNMWDTKLKATNEQTRQRHKNLQTQIIVWWSPEEKGVGGVVQGKGVQIHGDRRRFDSGW